MEDIGAAAPAYKVIWNNPKEIANIVIHPGGFQMLKRYFQKFFHNNEFSRPINNTLFSKYIVFLSVIIVSLAKLHLNKKKSRQILRKFH